MLLIYILYKLVESLNKTEESDLEFLSLELLLGRQLADVTTEQLLLACCSLEGGEVGLRQEVMDHTSDDLMNAQLFESLEVDFNNMHLNQPNPIKLHRVNQIITQLTQIDIAPIISSAKVSPTKPTVNPPTTSASAAPAQKSVTVFSGNSTWSRQQEEEAKKLLVSENPFEVNIGSAQHLEDSNPSKLDASLVQKLPYNSKTGYKFQL